MDIKFINIDFNGLLSGIISDCINFKKDYLYMRDKDKLIYEFTQLTDNIIMDLKNNKKNYREYMNTVLSRILSICNSEYGFIIFFDKDNIPIEIAISNFLITINTYHNFDNIKDNIFKLGHVIHKSINSNKTKMYSKNKITIYNNKKFKLQKGHMFIKNYCSIPLINNENRCIGIFSMANTYPNYTKKQISMYKIYIDILINFIERVAEIMIY